MSKDQKELERRVLHVMNKCKHFTGIQNETCKAGVNYRVLVGGPEFGWVSRIPCFSDEKETDITCDNLETPTAEEARQKVEDDNAHIEAFIAKLNSSICPICDVQVRQHQVGSCVYGTCGHRLYQGRVNREFAAK